MIPEASGKTTASRVLNDRLVQQLIEGNISKGNY